MYAYERIGILMLYYYFIMCVYILARPNTCQGHVYICTCTHTHTQTHTHTHTHTHTYTHTHTHTHRGVCTKPPCYCVVMEYCSQGNLYDHLKSENEVLPPQVVCWARQIADGMLYLHSKKIIHRDLKSLK